MWYRWGHPDLEKHDRSETGGLNRWIVRHPLRAPVTGFVIAGILFALWYFIGAAAGPLPIMVGAFLAVISLLLLVYGLIRKATEVSVGRIEKAAPPPEEPTEADRLTRKEALSRWRTRARQEAEEERIKKQMR